MRNDPAPITLVADFVRVCVGGEIKVDAFLAEYPAVLLLPKVVSARPSHR